MKTKTGGARSNAATKSPASELASRVDALEEVIVLLAQRVRKLEEQPASVPELVVTTAEPQPRRVAEPAPLPPTKKQKPAVIEYNGRYLARVENLEIASHLGATRWTDAKTEAKRFASVAAAREFWNTTGSPASNDNERAHVQIVEVDK